MAALLFCCLVGCQDSKPDTLRAAVILNDTRYIQDCLSQGMNVNHRYQDQNTLLHFARTPAMAELLIRHGADVDAMNHLRNTPLHAASQRGLIEVVETLLKNKAQVNLANHQGQTPLFWAVRSLPPTEADFEERYLDRIGTDEEKARIATLLLEHGADPHHQDAAGRDIFMIASQWEERDSPAVQAVFKYLSKDKEGVGVR